MSAASIFSPVAVSHLQPVELSFDSFPPRKPFPLVPTNFIIHGRPLAGFFRFSFFEPHCVEQFAAAPELQTQQSGADGRKQTRRFRNPHMKNPG